MDTVTHKRVCHDAATGETWVEEMTPEEIEAARIGEQAAPEPVEEEGSPDAPVADSSSGPSAD